VGDEMRAQVHSMQVSEVLVKPRGFEMIDNQGESRNKGTESILFVLHI
jgi:hypothetical protein